MNKVGLIGYPVEHSVSPAMHNAAFAHLGMDDWHYELLPTPPAELPQRIAALKAEGYVGANVTVPHKQAVIPLLDRVGMAARGVNAVNTILRNEAGQLEGHNTDTPGFILDLEAHNVEVAGKHALVLGAGGSAHAVVLGLANRGATVTIINRTEHNAWQLREDVRKGVSRQFRVNVQPQKSLQTVLNDADLIVNCTPLGMWPEVNASPLPDDVQLKADSIIYDLVYRPAKTRLLEQAEQAGAQAIGGIGMLIYQGAAAFELWTGQTAPVEVMRKAALQALEQHE
jgi:shikimate dehydrogenase